MEEQDGEIEVRRGWLRWLITGLALLTLVLLALWTQRAPIAENFISRELNRRGVQADYELTQVGVRTQRIENIVLGDPANPDLTAKWVEIDIAYAGVTPQLSAVRAGGVRMRASYRGGVLDMGELDRFSDPSSKAPFSLPDIMLSLIDARMRLDTDAGQVGLKLDGKGNLLSGFRGKLAATMPRANLADCGLVDGTAWLDVAMRDGGPQLSGPVRASALACAGAATAMARPAANIDVKLSKAFDRWSGSVQLAGDALKSNGLVLAAPGGRIDFAGTAARTSGRARLNAVTVKMGETLAGSSELTGAWQVDGGAARVQGLLKGQSLRFAGNDPLGALRLSAAGTPVGPLAVRLADAVKNLNQANSFQSTLALVQRGGVASLVVTDTRLTASSGAQVGLAPGGRATIAWPGPGGRAMDWALDGSVTTQGGGLPSAALRLARRAGGGFGGQLFMDSYAAGDARLALEPVRFVATPGGATRFSTVMRVDGPLPDGQLRGLNVPIEGHVAANGAISVNPRCVPVSLTQARYGAFAVGQTRQTLCPLAGGPLLAIDQRGVRGGAEVRKLALIGQSGDSPLRLSADTARITLGNPGFTLANLDVAVGPQESPVRFTATSLTGRSSASGLGGQITGGGGRIGTVPLIIEDVAGDWGFAAGTLKLAAALRVRDSQPAGRFNPLAVPDFALVLRDGRIIATGGLRVPGKDALVARVDIAHDLGTARGHADLTVPGLAFGPALQPEEVTALTLGVVANVNGTITGKGHIRWTGSDVTSDGIFRTDSANLAAAFGPVEGVSGEIRFTDLLGLVTAPGQVANIKVVNPGVEVRDGVVRYRLEPNQKVRIEGGEFPFSGGQLLLLATTMDFGADVDRYMTFRVVGIDAGAFIQAMELDNVSATGTFDGIMPLVFNAQGGRVTGGVLTARQQGMPPLLMPEGVLPTIPCDPTRQSGALSYIGPVSNEQLGVMGKIAFDALKNLQYKCLTILMDGALDGEMVTNVVFNGINQGQVGVVPSMISRSFIGLPFIFNVRISAPFRGLMGAAQSFIDPSGLIRNSLGDQMQEKIREGVAVQPAESETMSNEDKK